mgnify:CR=1 FL=1|tara:strand:- start:1644 stop:1826 length:183 start_codon:yes stop_codon:yes gene_type:complete
MKIRYDLHSAYEAGHTEHPQKEMKKLGFEVLSFEGVPIADCAIMEIMPTSNDLPSFLEVI